MKARTRTPTRAVASRGDATPTVASATKALISIAKKLKIAIHENETSFVTNGAFTLAHAPVVGIERYTAADFAAGAPIQVILINSRRPGKVPNGTYMVKAQLRSAAKAGKALLVADSGAVVGQLELIVRTRAQLANVFPDVYSDPQNIPTITSDHLWLGDQTHKGDLDYGHWGVDCTGVNGTLYFWSS